MQCWLQSIVWLSVFINPFHAAGFRSSTRRCSIGKDVLKNFAKFTRKHLCRSLFFNKVAGLRPATLLKRDSGTVVFLWILRNFQEHLLYRTLLDDCFYVLLLYLMKTSRNVNFPMFSGGTERDQWHKIASTRISFVQYINLPPSSEFLARWYCNKRPVFTNWKDGNKSSILVSEITSVRSNHRC